MHTKLTSLIMALSFIIAIPAQAETWSCEYDGSWLTYNSSNKGSFNWSVIWKSKPGGWEITGNYSDRYGISVLNGNCNNHACSLTQVYQSGELSGNQYFWKGKYTDQANGSNKTINRFEGSWGSTPRANEGSWQALATCVRH